MPTPAVVMGRYRDGSVPALIIDILDTYFGEWFSVDELVYEAQRIRPGVTEAVVRRSLQRMVHHRTFLVRRRYAKNKRDGVVQIIEVSRPTRSYYKEAS